MAVRYRMGCFAKVRWARGTHLTRGDFFSLNSDTADTCVDMTSPIHTLAIIETTGEPFQAEYRMYARDGSIRWPGPWPQAASMAAMASSLISRFE